MRSENPGCAAFHGGVGDGHGGLGNKMFAALPRILKLNQFAFKRSRHVLGRGLNENQTSVLRSDNHSPIGKLHKSFARPFGTP